MTKIDGLEIVMTKQMQKMIDKELKKRFEELKPELATRYEELLNMRNMEADQFNDGFNDARAGKLETDHPHYDFDTDNWRLGYAWGMFETMKEKLARERQVSDALYLLLVDDPNTKLKADQILIDIYGKCEPSPSDVSVTQDVTTPEPHIRGGDGSHWEGCEEVHLDCRISQLEKEIARLNVELAETREQFEVTDDLLNQATVTIGAVIACCTYNSNEDAKIGIYGISPDAFTRIDQFITNYNRAVSAGKVSVDVKPVKRDLSDAEIEELGAREAESRGDK